MYLRNLMEASLHLNSPAAVFLFVLFNNKKNVYPVYSLLIISSCVWLRRRAWGEGGCMPSNYPIFKKDFSF